MTELKTLKDLEVGVSTSNWEEVWVRKEDLRQEAIKWYFYKQGSNIFEDRQVVNFIRDFFNITEEDLRK